MKSVTHSTAETLLRTGATLAIACLVATCHASSIYTGKNDDLAALMAAVERGEGTLTIAEGRGGRLVETIDALEWLKENEIPVQVINRCASACTLLLGYEKLCYGQKAEFWFHSARFEDGDPSQLGNAILKARYPDWLQQWLADNAGLDNVNGWTILSAKELATIDPQPRYCLADLKTPLS